MLAIQNPCTSGHRFGPHDPPERDWLTFPPRLLLVLLSHCAFDGYHTALLMVPAIGEAVGSGDVTDSVYGRTHAEIANYLGLPTGTIKAWELAALRER